LMVGGLLIKISSLDWDYEIHHSPGRLREETGWMCAGALLCGGSGFRLSYS
jgi:hypothetical protein